MSETPLANLRTVDLFCGAGGLTLGLHAAGYETVTASDVWEPAVATFRHNLSSVPFLAADVRDVSARDLLLGAPASSALDLVVGGPPCQGFSSAGARREDDNRNSLVAEFGRLVAELRPRAFLFENVEGFLTAGGGRFIPHLLDPVIEAGYRVSVRKFNVANWGVPQLRKRVIGIGVLYGEPPSLVPTHRATGAPGVHRVGHRELPLAPSIIEGLAGLGPVRRSATESPTDHVVPKVSAMDAERIRALRPGQTMRDLPDELQHDSYRRRANRRVADGMPTERRGGAPAGLRRLVPDEPAKAITGAAQREMIHPVEDRPLTLRECARLQTFPDDFEFLGTMGDRRILVGNAVPPAFAARVGEQVAHALRGMGRTPAKPGLATFDVTYADGKSPALRGVEQDVWTRYGSDSQLSLLDAM